MRKFTFIVTSILFNIYLNATECDSLVLTSDTYSETDDLIAAIQEEFGSEYTIGDWTDLQDISDIDNWISCMGFPEDQTFMLTKNGEYFYNSDRQYYVHYSSDGIPYPGFLVHDQIGNLYLGSWYGLDKKILSRNGVTNNEEFITEFYDLNDNEVPDGWELFVHNAPVDIENGHLHAAPTDARGCLMRSGIVPEGTTKMVFEWDGNLAYTYWGMCNQLQLDFNQDEYLKVYIQTADYNFGSEINRMFIRYFDGSDGEFVYQTDIPITLTDFHYKIEVWGNNLRMVSTILSDDELYFDETIDIVNLVPSFSLESINKVRFWAYTTTDNDNWLDNISVEVTTTTVINDVNNEPLLLVYPNPATGQIKLKSNTQYRILGIYNIHGQIVSGGSGFSVNDIDISNLDPGIYFLSYGTIHGEVTGVTKFVKD